MHFQLNFGNDACGADGIAFVLQTDGTGIVGSDPGRQAADGHAHYIAVDFDTFDNFIAPYSDPVYDSLNIRTNASGANDQTNAGPISCGGTGIVSGPTGCFRPQISSTSTTIKDGADHDVRITWDAATFTLTVYVNLDPTPRATWILPSTYVSTIFNNTSSVYFGLTAATGGSKNFHEAGMISGTNGATDLTTNPCALASTPVVATPTPLVLPTSACGTPTTVPSFTASPTIPPPTGTFTVSPTPYPTICGAAPAFVQSGVINGSGCTGSGNPVSWSYTVPAGPGQVLIVNVETGGGGTISGVTYNGVGMLPLPSNSAVAITGGGTLYTYYMVNPPTGTFTLAPTGINGCSWNVVPTLYQNIDTASPLGATNTNSGNSANVIDTITTTTGYSIIHDFFALQSGPGSYTGTYGTQLFPAGTGACCDNVYGSYTNTTAPGAHSNNYILGSSKPWTGVSVELKPATGCGTPTSTPTNTIQVSPTDSPTPSPTPTFTRTVTNTGTPVDTFTRTSTPTISPTFTSPPTNTPVPTNTPLPPKFLLHLYPNSPNPAGEAGTHFSYGLTTDAVVNITVYDVAGEVVRTLDPFPGKAGANEEFWDGKNSAHTRVASGVFIYKVEATSVTDGTQKSDFSRCAVLR